MTIIDSDTLEASLDGSLIRPGDPIYDSERSVWNAVVDRQPALIVRCASANDVAVAVAVAKREGLSVAVRGSGHHPAGYCVCDGIVIDLSQLKRVDVDADAGVARVQPGATWADVDRETQAAGLATTGASVSPVGVAGHTLGGGQGWLMRECGLTCDNLIAADLVTSDGKTLSVTDESNPELLWALRGGGGNFGIVTELTLRLHSVGPVLGGIVGWPLERGRDLLRLWRDWLPTTSERLTQTIVTMMAPPEEFIPAELHGQPLLVIGFCHLDPARGRREMEALHEVGVPPVQMIDEMPYPILQRMFDAGAPAGMRNYWESTYLRALDDDLIDVAIDRATNVTSPLSSVHIHSLGGAVARAAGTGAFAHHDAAFELHFAAMWQDAGDDDAARAWAQSAFELASPRGVGSYVNHMSDANEDRVSAVYDPATLARLRVVKREFDPDNFFRTNLNVVP